MNEQALIEAIALAIPKDRANATQLAGTFLTMAKSKLARMDGVDFNRSWVTFTLQAGKKAYQLGKDVVSKYPNIWSAGDFWRLDVQNWPIVNKGIEDFRYASAGDNSSGPPRLICLHSYNQMMEVYPTPDSAYEIGVYVKFQNNDIAAYSQYWDVLYSLAITLINASANPALALELTKAGIVDVKSDGIGGYTGNIIHIERPLGNNMNVTTTSSGNIYGD